METNEVFIRSLGSAGEGVGTVNGFPIFIEGALPGEEVAAEITVKKSRYAKGRIVEILKHSEHRTKPFCPLFGRCGGCQVQHLDYEGQLVAKRQRVIDALRRIGHLETEVLPCLAAPSPTHYRNKIQMPLHTGEVGFFEHGTHNVVPVESCPIHRNAGEEAFRAVRPLLLGSKVRYLVIKSSRLEQRALCILVTDGKQPVKALAEKMCSASPFVAGVVECINQKRGNSILTDQFRHLAGESHLIEELCGKQFRISPASFFQVNPEQAENLYQTALSFLDPPKEAHLLDAFCGVGTLSIIASDRVETVTGIEAVPQAIEDAKANGVRNGATNCHFVCGRVEEKIGEAPHFDYAILNPPRKGCDPAVIGALAERIPKRMVYLSCDPATLARDLTLLEKSGFKTIQVQPIDMFPQTMHVESVALITL